MTIHSIKEEEAEGEIKLIYQKLKKALKTTSLPVFFTFIAPYREYFIYISEQLIENLNDQKFLSLVYNIKDDIISLIKDKLEKGERTKQWILNYKNSPFFYHFQTSLDSIFLLNLKLVFIFIALREAIKGWAVGAKKLNPSFEENLNKSSRITEDEFIYNLDISQIIKQETTDNSDNSLVKKEFYLQKSGDFRPEQNFLFEYLSLCRFDFSGHMKKDYFWIMRVGIEKLFLTAIPMMPQLIFSPINVFFSLTKKHDPFPLAYYLTELFPVLAVHRMIFSGFLKEE